MAFLIEPGRIRILGPANHTVFDSNSKLFTCTDTKVGNITMPTRTATFNGSSGHSMVVLSLPWFLASVNAAAQVVLGSFFVAAPAGQGVANLGWFCAGGTYVHEWEANGAPSTTSSRQFVEIRAGYTFYVSAGGLYLLENIILKAQTLTGTGVTTSVTLPGPTFSYHLFCGTFT